MGTTMKDLILEGGILNKGFRHSPNSVPYRVEDIFGIKSLMQVRLQVRYLDGEPTKEYQFRKRPEIVFLADSLNDEYEDLSMIQLPPRAVLHVPRSYRR